MKRTDWPEMHSCDGCAGQPVTNACCTIVRVRPAEAKRIRRYVDDNNIKWGTEPTSIQCGFLKDGQCSIYDVRPWVCRAFGVVKQLPCSRFPEEAVIDFPQQQAINLRLSDPSDRFLGEYFEVGYNKRLIEVLKNG